MVGLEGVRPHPDTVWVRREGPLLLMCLLLFAACAAVVWAGTRAPVFHYYRYFFGAVVIFIAGFFGIHALPLPRSRYAQFRTRGGALLFDVGNPGNPDKSFDAFVARITEVVTALQQGMPGPGR